MYLNHIQLKSARCALNLGVRDIGSLIQTSRTTVSKLENNIINLSNMRLGSRRNVILKEFFKKHKIVFPDSYSIELHPFSKDIKFSKLENQTLTRFQFKIARIIMNKTQSEIADQVHVSSSVIKKAESYDNQTLLTSNNISSIPYLLNILKEAGLEFPSPNLVVFQNFS